jgi:phosphinothricin acetyltransferase
VTEGPRIRDARDDDVPAITELQNALLATTPIEWTDTEHTIDGRAVWLAARRAAGDAVVVAEVSAEVVGFAAYADFRDTTKWPGYRLTVEHTIHVARSQWGTGVGRRLMEALVDRAVTAGKHVIVAAIDAENEDSIRFHERLGFVEVARMPEVGTRFGRWLTLVMLQRIIGSPEPPPG